MKASVILKRSYESGVIQTIELFKYKKGTVLHRHVLTKDKKMAELYGIHRKFWDTYYCMQEFVIMDDELDTLLEYLTKKDEHE